MLFKNKLICVDRVLLVMNLTMSISEFIFDFDQLIEILMFFTISIERKTRSSIDEKYFVENKVLHSIVETIIRFFRTIPFR